MEENGDPLASRRITETPRSSASGGKSGPSLEVRVGGNTIKEARSRQGVAFGFKSLDPVVSGNSPYAQEYFDVQNGTQLAAEFVPPSDLCSKCNTTIENGCIRLGTYTRWHAHCLACDICGKTAGPPPANKGESKASVKSVAEMEKDEDSHEESEATKREIRAKLQERLQTEAAAEQFTYILNPPKTTTSPGSFVSPEIPGRVLCSQHKTGASLYGFQSVSRLEQYSYLLNVALLRLYSILKRRGAIQSPTGAFNPPHVGVLLTERTYRFIEKEAELPARVYGFSTLEDCQFGQEKHDRQNTKTPYNRRKSGGQSCANDEPDTAVR